MTIPSFADSDPDPTTQQAWPSARSKTQKPINFPTSTEFVDDEQVDQQEVKKVTRRRLSTWNLITLSISMAGAQIAWTVELGYGTPFLLSLGLSEQLTSLVWLAGPISGLIAQPIIGAISDASTSKYRRRYWIALSTVILVFSTMTLAFCQEIAAVFVDLFGGGAADWDPKRIKQVANIAIWMAIISFYLLDFALNALQASLRNLLLDITPPDQLNSGNAWHGRMTHAGNIAGFGFGFLPLADLPILRLLGGGQFRKFCIVAMAILVATVWITCWCHEEKAKVAEMRQRSKFFDVLENIYNAIVKLPKPIRRVCYVQVFAFMGWFPFLFYATTYIGQVMAYEHNAEPDKDLATRKGEGAMLIYSIVAVAAGTLLPHLANRDRRLLFHAGDEDEDVELTRLRDTVHQWKLEAARKGRPLRLPVMPFLLRNLWTGALLLFTVLTWSTFIVTTVVQATVLVSLVGICWAVACWVPFAIIMEFLKESDTPAEPHREVPAARRPSHARAISTPSRPLGLPTGRPGERMPLLRSRSYDAYNAGGDVVPEKLPVAGGTILGIHNLAIVFPQFLVAIASSVIFRYVDGETEGEPGNGNTYLGKTGVAWVLRFGGLCTLIGAMIARMVPPTSTEKQMRRRLGEMREVQREEASTP